MDDLHQLIALRDQFEDYMSIIQGIKRQSLHDYNVVVFEGARVCEQMLLRLLLHNGYTIEYGKVINKGEPPTPILDFCCRNLEFIPVECQQSICSIHEIRDSAYLCGCSNTTVNKFAKEYDFFSNWFQQIYLAGSELDKGLILQLKRRFFSLEKVWNKEDAAKDPFQYLESIEVETEYLADTDEIDADVNLKLELIKGMLDNLCNQMTSYQSLVERQLNTAVTEEEKDRIISAFIEEYIDQTKDKTYSSASSKELVEEEKQLRNALGEDAWGKMEAESKTYLITAKVMFNHLASLGNMTDYSGVCILVTKTLEREMKRRFYSDFLEYLDNKYQREYALYHTALVRNSMMLESDKFTMGCLAYVFCYYINQHDTPQQIKNNSSQLVEFVKLRLMTKSSEKEIEVKMKTFAKDIETIREKYRNPAAHTNALKKTNAEKCFDFVIDSQRVLRKILETLDY